MVAGATTWIIKEGVNTDIFDNTINILDPKRYEKNFI